MNWLMRQAADARRRKTNPTATRITGNSSTRRARRRGLSLMEVVFSVGVIVVGLLGVAVLIPAAGRLAAKGNMLDQAARAGVSWVRDFEVRGYGQPASWVIPDATNTAAYQDDPLPNTGLYRYEKSFCIDPRFVATNGVSTFPYVTGAAGDPRMQRISLRTSPGGVRLTQEQADELFISHDDLSFDRPADPTQIPVQRYGQANTDKRQSEDRLSYLVTVVPKLQGGNLYRDVYTLSIVVLKNRDPAMSTGAQIPPKPDNERLVDVPSPALTGAVGNVQVGDVQLRAKSGRTAAQAQADLTVHRGDWVMLARNIQPYAHIINNAVRPSIPHFRWYRVVHANDPYIDGSGNWVADVTLHGPDWSFDTTFNGPTEATILTDVVAVYEKTLHLEQSSLWMR